MFGESTNWIVSSVLALGLHGGLLFAFADKISATISKKPKIEITLLDLPSISVPVKTTAKPVVRLQQKKSRRIKPAKTRDPERLQNSNSSGNIKKLSKPSQELLKNSRNAQAVEKLKAVAANRLEKVRISEKVLLPVDANKTVPIAKKAVTNKERPAAAKMIAPVLAKTKSKPVISEKRPIEKLTNRNEIAKKPATATPAMLALATPKKLMAVKANKSVPVAKIAEDNKIRPAAAKTIAPALAKTRPKPVITAKRPLEKLVSRNEIAKKPTKSAPVKLALATPKNLLPVEANKSVPVAKDRAKNIIKNGQRPITAKIDKTVLVKPKPKRVPSTKRRPKKLVKQNKSTLKVAPSKKPKPLQPPSTRRAAKPVIKNSRITAAVTKKTFAQKIAAAPVKRAIPLRKSVATPARINSPPRRINKINIRPEPAKLSSSKTRLAASTTKLKSIKRRAKKNIQIARVKIRKKATRIKPVERIGKPLREPPSSTPAKLPEQLAMLTRPNPVPDEIRPSPTKNQIDDFGKVMKFLKFHKSDNRCFLALPAISNSERMELVGFSNEKNSWSRFQKAISESTRFKIPGQLNTISDAQCQVMMFARQNNLYPSFSSSIQVDRAKIANGEIVTGKLYVGKGRYFYFYVVDDEGTAINVNKYVKTKGADTIFKLQINLTGDRVSTAQLLLAIVADQSLASTRFPDPIPVNSLLKNIQNEISDRNIKLDLALSAFTVE